VAAIAELRRSHRQHPPELAAPEDADGLAGRYHVGLLYRVVFDKLRLSGLCKNIRSG
jgi:hypothetical protein